MDPSLDDFLNFQNSNAEPLKIDFSAFDFGLDHTDSNDNDLFRNVPLFNSKSIQNMLDQDPQQNNLTDMFNFDAFQANNVQQYQLDNNQNNQVYERCSSFDQTESTCSPNTNENNDQTLVNGSKKITKREKAKLKAKAKQDALDELLETVDKKYIPDGFYDPNIDPQTKKKMIQVIRNRVSAQTSRDKKKAMVTQIVDVKSTLEQRNQDLEKQNEYLAQQLLNSQAQCRSLQEQLEALKKSSACLKCGPTSDFGTNETMETTEDSASLGSSPPSPLLYRGGGVRGKMFGFGAAFTTLMCFIMFMNMNMNSIPQAGRTGVKTHLVQKVRNLGAMCPKNSTNAADKILYKEKEINLENTNAQANDDIKLETMKSLVDTFENFSEKVYKAFESSQLVVDLSNRKFEHEEKPSKITKTSFLGKNNATKAAKVNTTSTIFINSGIEFSRNDSNKPLSTQTQFQEEVIGADGMLQKDTDLDLGKADYVQLFVPKSSLGQINNNKLNGDFGNLPTLEDEEEQDTMLEVWCKVFAVRETSATL